MNHSSLYDLSTENHTLLYDFVVMAGSEALEAAARQMRRAGRPTQNSASQKSENLLEVATTLFAERGFNGTTMLEIAEAADLGRQAVYGRFPDKESLFIAVITRLRDENIFQPAPPEDALPVGEGLRKRLRAIMSNCAEPKPTLIHRLVMRDGNLFPDLFALLGQSTLEFYTGPLAAYLSNMAETGLLRPIDAMEVATTCMDLIFAEHARAAYRGKPLTAAHINRHADRIAALVIRGIEKS
jgi:AcrR family transcriptional regulator